MLAKLKCFFFLSLNFFNVFNLIYFVVTAVFSWPKASLKNLDENLALSSINNKQKTHLISGCRQLVVPSYHSLNKFKFLVFHTQGTYSVYIHMYVCMYESVHTLYTVWTIKHTTCQQLAEIT